ncbi:MAG: hypothetical protein AAF533_30135 [Acidobacteriota bacterium]
MSSITLAHSTGEISCANAAEAIAAIATLASRGLDDLWLSRAASFPCLALLVGQGWPAFTTSRRRDIPAFIR